MICTPLSLRTSSRKFLLFNFHRTSIHFCSADSTSSVSLGWKESLSAPTAALSAKTHWHRQMQLTSLKAASTLNPHSVECRATMVLALLSKEQVERSSYSVLELVLCSGRSWNLFNFDHWVLCTHAAIRDKISIKPLQAEQINVETQFSESQGLITIFSPLFHL